MPNPTRSSVVIARLLESEGFTAHTANAVMKYARRVMHHTTRSRYERNRMAAKAILRELDEGAKAVVGKFITHQMKASFDAGLRVGLAAHAELNSKPCHGIPYDRPSAESDVEDATN